MQEEIIFTTWQSHDFELDMIVAASTASHLSFRQWCVDNDKELPPLTKGLAQEVLAYSVDYTITETQSHYHLTWSEVTRAIYGTLGTTEPEYDLEGLKKDLMAGTLKMVTIAAKYGVSQARVSQIAKYSGISSRTRKHRKPLTEEEIQDIKASDLPVPALLEKYNIVKSTYYKVIKA